MITTSSHSKLLPPKKPPLHTLKEYQQGIHLLQHHHYHDAIDKFKIIIKKNSRYSPDLFTSLYKRVLDHYDHIQTRLAICDLYIFCKQYQDALTELEELLTIDPKESQVYYLLGRLYNRAQSPDFLYEDSLSARPLDQTTGPAITVHIQSIFENSFNNGVRDPIIIDLLPTIYLKNNQVEKSISFFLTLTEQYKDNIGYLKTLAELYETARQFENAVSVYADIAETSPPLLDECAKSCEKITHFFPQSKDIRLTTIQLYFKACNPDKACHHIELLTQHYPQTIPGQIQTLKHTLKTFPGSTVIQILLAKLLIHDAQFTEGLHYLNTVYSDNKNHESIIFPILTQALKANPNQVTGLELLVDIHLHNRTYDSALVELEKLIELNTSSIPAYQKQCDLIKTEFPDLQNKTNFILAKSYALTQNEKLLLKCVEALEHTDLHQDAILVLSQFYMTSSQFGKARLSILNHLHTTPFNMELHTQLKTILDQSLHSELEKRLKQDLDTAQHYLEIGLIYLRHHTISKAIESFQKIDPPSPLSEKAKVLISRCFMDQGRYDISANNLTPIIVENRSMMPSAKLNKLRFLLAINQGLNGQIESGISTLEDILSSDINFPNLHTMLDYYKGASSMESKGKMLSGATFLGTENFFCIPNCDTKITPVQELNFSYQHNNKGVQFFLRDQLQSAEEEFNLALSIDPTLLSAINNLALVELKRGNMDAAHALVKRGQALHPTLDAFYLTESLLHQKQEKWTHAFHALNKVLRNNAKHPTALLQFGDMYYQEGKLEKAFQNWEKVSIFGLYFYLLQSRLAYLQSASFSYTNWCEDFYISSSKQLEVLLNKPIIPAQKTPAAPQKQNTSQAVLLELPFNT